MIQHQVSHQVTLFITHIDIFFKGDAQPCALDTITIPFISQFVILNPSSNFLSFFF